MSNDVLTHRVGQLETAFEHVNTALRGIDDSLRTLTALEAHHAQTRADTQRALDALKDHDHRLRALELDIPGLRLVSKYIIVGAVALIGIVGAAVVKLVVPGA